MCACTRVSQSVSVLQSLTQAFFRKNETIQYKNLFNTERSEKMMHLLPSYYTSGARFSSPLLTVEQDVIVTMSVMKR